MFVVMLDTLVNSGGGYARHVGVVPPATDGGGSAPAELAVRATALVAKNQQALLSAADARRCRWGQRRQRPSCYPKAVGGQAQDVE